MLAVNQDNVEKSVGQMLQGLAGALVGPLVFVGRRLGIWETICWFQDERRRAAMIHELSRLNDHYLRDVGIYRSEIEEVADAMVRRRRESRRAESRYPGRARPS